MNEFLRLLDANIYLWLGITLTGSAAALLSVRSRYPRLNRLAALCVSLLGFGYWSFYWHWRCLGVPEGSALVLSALPTCIAALFVSREKLAAIASKIGRVKVGDLEVEFSRAAENLERNLTPTFNANDSVFAPKLSLQLLPSVVRQVVDHLATVPPSRRTAYVRIDGLQKEFHNFDAAALYLYLISLREALVPIDGSVGGILFYAGDDNPQLSLGVVDADDYVAVFERQFTAARLKVALQDIRAAVDPRIQRTDAPTFIESLGLQIGAGTSAASLDAFLPVLMTYVRRVSVVAEGQLPETIAQLPRLFAEGIAYLLITRQGHVVSVVPLADVAISVACSMIVALRR
jgi:hypothetical protein